MTEGGGGSDLSPSGIMRARHPELFPDSLQIQKNSC